MFRRSLRSLPSRALLDQEMVSICTALEHIKNHGNLDRLPGTRSHRLALMTTATRQGLAVWNRSSERYELTSFGQQRLGSYGASLAMGRSGRDPRPRRGAPGKALAAVGAIACLGLVVWASPRLAADIGLVLATSPAPPLQIAEAFRASTIDVPCGQPETRPEQRNCLGTVGRNIGRVRPDLPLSGLAGLPIRPQVAAALPRKEPPAVEPGPDRAAGSTLDRGLGQEANRAAGPASSQAAQADLQAEETVRLSGKQASSLPSQTRLPATSLDRAEPQPVTLPAPTAADQASLPAAKDANSLPSQAMVPVASLDRLEPKTLPVPTAADQAVHDNPPLETPRSAAVEPPTPSMPTGLKPVDRSRGHSASQRRLAQWKRMRARQNDFWGDWQDRPPSNIGRTIRADRGQRGFARRPSNELRDGLAFTDNDRRSRFGFFSWAFR